MRSISGGVVLVTVCVVVAGCGGATTPEEPPATDIPTSEPSGLSSPTGEQQPTPRNHDDPTEKPDPPGVPGSPIDYDSTLLYAPEITPDLVKISIEGELESKSECGSNRCGVKVVIKGHGDCAVAIGPDPVLPGQTITITAGSCTSPEEPPGSEDVTPPTDENIPSSGG